MIKLSRGAIFAFGAIVAIAGLFSSPAQSAIFTYATSGAFTAGAGATSIANGITFTQGGTTLQLVFNGENATVDTTVGADLGGFALTVVGPGTVTVDTSIPSTFALTVKDGASSTLGVFNATLSGTIGQNTGYLALTFSNTAFTAGLTSFVLVNLTTGYATIPNDSHVMGPDFAGPSRITALIKVVPEPSALLALASGLGGLAFIKRRQ